MDTGTWMVIAQACQALGKSERTIRRWIDNKKLPSRQGDNGIEVLVEPIGTETGIEAALPLALPGELQARIVQLKAELERRDRQITELQKDNRHLREQLQEKDKRIMELHQVVAVAQSQAYQLLERLQTPFWRRLFKRKALPAPENVVDMETDTNKEG